MVAKASRRRAEAAGEEYGQEFGVAGGSLKLAIFSHSHPALSSGGAEIAAYQQYSFMREVPGIKAHFIAAGGGRVGSRDGVQFSQPFGPNEYLYVGSAFDHYIHANGDPQYPSALKSLLLDLSPDIIHLHHYTNFGVETFKHIKDVLPESRIVLTLHEYLAICNHFGQMVKRPSFRLCSKSSLRECSRCFPDRTEQDFFLREMYIKRFFKLVDYFISPSQFLADRYVAWGVPRAKIHVIENGMPETIDGRIAEAAVGPDGDVLRLGFFGQISTLKGINVLIDAARILEESGQPNVRFEIYGDYSGQPPAFRAKFEEDLVGAPKSFVYMGPYLNSDVNRLMRSVDAVLVPSIWWENSPLVIQEAFRSGRPVICSDIGGMAEKVRDGLDGYHFQAGNPVSLVALVRRLLDRPDDLARLSSTLRTPPSLTETVQATLNAYTKLLTL